MEPSVQFIMSSIGLGMASDGIDHCKFDLHSISSHNVIAAKLLAWHPDKSDESRSDILIRNLDARKQPYGNEEFSLYTRNVMKTEPKSP